MLKKVAKKTERPHLSIAREGKDEGGNEAKAVAFIVDQSTWVQEDFVPFEMDEERGPHEYQVEENEGESHWGEGACLGGVEDEDEDIQQQLLNDLTEDDDVEALLAFR